jgi:hypothetical protein
MVFCADCELIPIACCKCSLIVEKAPSEPKNFEKTLSDKAKKLRCLTQQVKP